MTYPPPPYADARCGTFVSGEAICGTWWVYPTRAGLRLGGYLPTVVLPDVIGRAGLRLGGRVPALAISPSAFVPPRAGLLLGGRLPALFITTIIQPPRAGLLLGAYLPDVAVVYLFPIVCTDLTLGEDTESDLVLVATGASDLTLSEAECL